MLVLAVPDNVGSAGLLHVVETVAPRLGVQLLIAPIRNAADIEDAFNRIRGDANTGVLVLPGAPAADNQGFFIISLAKRHHVPVIYPIRSFVTLGGLIFYGYDRSDQYRQAASYVDRILKGEARRLAGAGADEVRTGDQPQDGEGARPRGATDPARPRRRGDRMKRREFITLLGKRG